MGVVGVCVHDVIVNKGSLGGSESSLGSIHGDAATKADWWQPGRTGLWPSLSWHGSVHVRIKTLGV